VKVFAASVRHRSQNDVEQTGAKTYHARRRAYGNLELQRRSQRATLRLDFGEPADENTVRVMNPSPEPDESPVWDDKQIQDWGCDVFKIRLRKK